MEGAISINARVWLIGLFTLACLQPGFRAAWAAPNLALDSFEAQDAEMSPDGIITATQGIILHISSLIEGEIITVTASEASYDTNDGSAELSGEVVLTLQNSGLTVTCSRFYYDPLMERMEVEGVELKLPVSVLVPESRFPDKNSVSIHTKHFYNYRPDDIFLATGSAHFELSQSKMFFVLKDVRLTHHPDPDPDFFIHAEEVRMVGNDSIEIIDLELRISGYEVASWPKLVRSLTPSSKVFSLEFPQFRIHRDEGLSWKQGMKLDLDSFKTDGLFHLAGEHGILLRGFSYIEPSPGARLGVSYGTSSMVDINRVDLERDEKYNFMYEQHFRNLPGFANNIKLDLEYGDMSVTTRAQPSLGLQETTVSDTRAYASGEIEFDFVEIAPKVFVASGGMLELVDYQDSGNSYNVVGGSLGLVWQEPGFDHFVVYKVHNITGEDLSGDGSFDEAVFSFDEVRRQELDLVTSFQILPEFRHILRAVYDIDKEEFDLLQFGTMKRQKTYEIGFYYDFARENAGLEFGFLFD